MKKPTHKSSSGSHSTHHRGSSSDTHPRHKFEHEHDDVVLGLDCTGWIKEWYKWAFETGGDNVFLMPSPDKMSFLPEVSGQALNKGGTNKEEGVWFLGYPFFNYTSEGTVIRNVNLPCGRLHFLAPVYNSHPSKELYPSIKSNQDLFKIAQDDVDKVYYLEVNLDGVNLSGCRVPIKQPFSIQLSKNSVMGIQSAQMNIVSDGYWIFIKELPLGDHILRLKGYSPLYKLDVEFHLSVRGPCK